MKVYKFGGASVKDAQSVKNVLDIISNTQGHLVLVISAMGKMTNAFEKLIHAYYHQKNYSQELDYIINYHKEIIFELAMDSDVLNIYLEELKIALDRKPSENYNFEYDQLIGFAELFSSLIVGEYMAQRIENTKWIDIREIIKTDQNYRFAKVNWEETIKNAKTKIDFSTHRIYLTQGFISSDSKGNTSSLGREGSDYSAAIISYSLGAESITIWKDVVGVLNADPRITTETVLLEKLSFYDAVELAFFGAQIIHPKTIQPLRNKKIPLYVRSFEELENKGTLVSNQKVKIEVPIVIVKENQVLLSITTRDFSFVDENNISSIFSILSEYNVKVNMMQNGAVSFSIAVDYIKRDFDTMIEKLNQDFDIRYNSKLKLITIRHYSEQKIEELIGDEKVYLEQKSRNTAQYLVNQAKE